MYVSSIFLDRFGHHANVRIPSLSNGLNVIWGKSGSGDTTLVDFLRGMWVGFEGRLRQQYVPHDSRGYGGTITVQTDQAWHAVVRYDDGSPEGRLTIEGSADQMLRRQVQEDFLGRVPMKLLDRAFFVNFQSRPSLDELLLAASLHGYQIVRRSEPGEQLRSLEVLLTEKKQRLAAIPASPVPTPKIPSHPGKPKRDKRSASQQVQSNESSAPRRCLPDSVIELERREDAVRAGLADLDRTWNELDAQRRQNEIRVGDSQNLLQHSESMSKRLAAIDAQLARWNRTLRDIVARKQRAAERTDNRQNAVATGTGSATPQRHLLALKKRIEESQQTLQQIAGKPDECLCRDFQASFREVFVAMQEDVDQLGNDLNYWQSYHLYRQAAGERDQLARCELELRQTIQNLTERRQAILCRIIDQKADTSAQLELRFTSEPSSPLSSSTDSENQNQNRHRNDRLETLNQELVRIDQLRHKARRELHEILAELAKVRPEPRNQEVKPEVKSKADAKSAASHRAAQNAEMRVALLRDIDALEEQLRRVRAEASSLNLADLASDYLRRLSSGQWIRMQVRSPSDVAVEDVQGRQVKYEELNAGTRDQVYLAFCLAVVNATGRNGLSIPLVLNGVFTHYPAKDVRDAIELLRDFAKDRQVLCVTEFEHVVGVARTLHLPIHRFSAQEAREETAWATTVEQLRQAGFDRSASPINSADREGTSQRQSKPTREGQLSEYDSIERAPSMDSTNASRLRKIGILRVGDLLRVPATEISADLRQWGISPEIVQSWQSQVRLVCGVAGLRSYDARILVACGITHPNQLADAQSKALRDRLRNFSLTAEGQALLMSGTESEMSRVIEWIQGPREAELNTLLAEGAGSQAAFTSPDIATQTVPAKRTKPSQPQNGRRSQRAA